MTRTLPTRPRDSRGSVWAALLAASALFGTVAAHPPARAQDPAGAAAAAKAEVKGADAQISERIESVVVKVFATTRRPDLSRPWTPQAPAEISGSGVVIEGNRILTNAHVVAYAGQIQVQAEREGDKYTAHVAAISHRMDLAVLTLEDKPFFQRHAPLERSVALPQIKDAVLAYGFPVGGTSLSITKGIVSRIEFTGYNWYASGLRVQIDAAINPGDSGGPATVGDRMIGLAFSSLGGAQNIGYIIPDEEIELFLHDVADGRNEGKPMLYDELQTLENPALRGFLKLAPSVHGVIVHRPFRHDADYPLHEWDVITAIAGVPVDDQGMILVDGNRRLGLFYEIQHSARDSHIALSLIRDGKPLSVDVPLVADRPALVKPLEGKYPSYFIYGPVVFSRASLEMVTSLRGAAGPGGAITVATSPLVTQLLDEPTPQREELVVMPAPLFPSALSTGYGGVVNSVVYAINGVPVRSLRHLVALLRDLKDDFVVISTDSKRGGEGLVLRRADVAAATEEILSENGIRAQGSADMMAVWQGKD